jgi:hypothetical protein
MQGNKSKENPANLKPERKLLIQVPVILVSNFKILHSAEHF